MTLLTAIETAPSRARAAATTSSTSAGLVMSAAIVSTRPSPSASTSAAASSRADAATGTGDDRDLPLQSVVHQYIADPTPPSMVIVTPVRYPAPSEHKKATAAA